MSLNSGKFWNIYKNDIPAMEGKIVNKLKVDNAGHISSSGTEVCKIYGTNGVDTVINYATTSAISGSLSGITYAPSGLNALYRVQGLDWNDAMSLYSSQQINSDISNPYATAQNEAEEILTKDPNIHGYEISYKEVNGVTTDQIALKFFVYQKKPIDQIETDKRIPSEIDNYVTDVVESEPIVITPYGTSLDTSSGGDLLTGDRVVTQNGSGTLGIIMINTETGKLVATTCAHVASSSFPTDGINGFTGSQNKSLIEGIAYWRNNPDTVNRGVVDRIAVARTTWSRHYTDLATLSITNLDKATPFVRTGDTSGGAFTDIGPVEWALPSEVTVGMGVFRKGRFNTDTGTLDQFDNNFYHLGTITSLEGTVSIGYSGITGAIPFGGIIRIQGRSAAGDSGCPMFVEVNGRKKYLGNLLGGVAGTETTGQIWVPACWYHSNRNSINGLPVKPWNGDLILSKRTTPTLNMFGRVYEFAGYTTLPVTHSDGIIDP